MQQIQAAKKYVLLLSLLNSFQAQLTKTNELYINILT